MNTTSKTSNHKLFCLIGPSGTGKDALKFMLELPYAVFHLSREIREGEVEGENGYYIPLEEFQQMVKDKQFVAHTEYVGNMYGVEQGELFPLEHSPMTCIATYEIAEQLRESFDKMEGYSADQVKTIFIHTPREDLRMRMVRRGTDKDTIKARLDRADRDYASASRCDYVVENKNGEMDKAAFDIMKIISKETFTNV